VCQRFSDKSPLIGHFRIVIGLGNDTIILHDPHPKHGGEAVRWNKERFIDFWKKTGKNVTGGVFVVIKKCNSE